ncbi:hypothetical protein GP486_004959 [Trichoglossum hirsutum]|uniref:Fungal lipase-type domain-containing protein n=1 Tax=Trichoglossum hirsutum TaxID=265104 RepID=A0A9P8LA67_9PEZI|nr:hypothetical protein GP486_004959 [Trichoglossum hirsutum]
MGLVGTFSAEVVLKIISTAWKCAAATYEEGSIPETKNMTFEVLKCIKPSTGGSVKTASVTLVEESPSLPTRNPHLPVLVIAVRGSKSVVDFVVNANCETEDTRKLFDINDLLPQTDSTHSLRAHAGFLNGAAALVKYIDSLVANSKAGHVLFCGHSAGGAVASLLFLKYLSNARKTASPQTFSCITFGSSPVTQPNISQILPKNGEKAPNLGLVLAIVNEYDLVSRADQLYVRSLVDLYRSLFQLPPIKDDKSGETGTTPSSTQEGSDLEASRPQVAKRSWDLPAPEIWLVGEVVLLRTEIVETQANDGQGKPTVDMKRALKVFAVAPEEFAKLLFCRISVHRRNEYHKRVGLIESGQFNAQNGW